MSEPTQAEHEQQQQEDAEQELNEQRQFEDHQKEQAEISDLTNIQNELVTPKNAVNEYAKYSYRNCESIMQAVKPLLKKYKSTLSVSDELMQVGNSIYVVAVCTFQDSKGKIIVNKAYAREADKKPGMSSEQVTGSASSYSRKYSLGGLFLLDDSEADPDSQNNDKQPQAPPQPVKPQVINDINKFLEVWEGGKVGNDYIVKYQGKDFVVSLEQLEVLRKSPKYQGKA